MPIAMAQSQSQSSTPRQPSLLLALIPIVLTLAMLAVQILIFDDFTPHIPLVAGIAITGIVGWWLGHSWPSVEAGAFHVVHVGLQSLTIILIIGMLIGSWLASGTVPMIIYYGLKVIDPSLFLVSAMVMCSAVSLSLGTSWTTCGTVGLAMMGVGEAFGVPTYWTAAAVVSGAFFGDKISPLSDTTNLAPAVTETNLFEHIRNLLPTTVPAMLIALAVYLITGMQMDTAAGVDVSQIRAMTTAIESTYALNPLVFAPVVIVIALAVTKMPPIPSLMAGVLSGVLVAIFVQGATIQEATQYLFDGYTASTGVDDLDTLLNRGGMSAMTWTLTLMMIALAFGGALERVGCMQTIVERIRSHVKSFAGLQTAAIASSTTTNLVSGDVYLSIALPGRMYKKAYDDIGYSRLNLSRAMEEGGTLMSPLIPWNAGGAFVISALGFGIAGADLINLLYIPLAVACWLSPVIGIAYAHLGWFSPRATADS